MTDNQKFNKINVVISIIIAFIAWVFVVYNYSPMKNVTYTNVPITYEGLDTLANRGYAIKSSTADSTDVVLAVERKDFGSVSVDDITIVADVSQAVEGHNGISLSVETPDGVKFKKLGTRMISIEVDDAVSMDVDLTPVYDKNIGNGTEPVAKSMSYRRVTVVGIQENIDKVSYAVVKTSNYDLDSNARSYVINPVAVDEKGKEVPHILVLPSEISANLVYGEVKEVPLNLEILNLSTGVFANVPQTVKIKGTADALEDIEEIDADSINLAGIEEDTTFSINYILPEGVFISQASLGKRVIVTKEK